MIGSRLRLAASWIARYRTFPQGVSLRTGSSTWANRRSPPSRSISAAAASGWKLGTTMLPRSRWSRSRNSSRTQLLTAVVSAASKYGLRLPWKVATQVKITARGWYGSRSWARSSA